MALVCLLFEESSSPSPHGGMANAPCELAATPQAEQDVLAHAVALRGMRDEIESQFTISAAGDGTAQLLFVGGENSDAISPARDGDIPLLRVRRGTHGGITKENVIYGLAL